MCVFVCLLNVYIYIYYIHYVKPNVRLGYTSAVSLMSCIMTSKMSLILLLYSYYNFCLIWCSIVVRRSSFM